MHSVGYYFAQRKLYHIFAGAGRVTLASLCLTALQMVASQKIPYARMVPPSLYAKEKGVSRQTVYSWIATGQVKHIKLGNTFYVLR